MKGLKVVCPICKGKYFETTEHYDPEKTPNGSMVRSLVPYPIDWLTSSTTLASEMTCPECASQLAPSGRLSVLDAVSEEMAQKASAIVDDLFEKVSSGNGAAPPEPPPETEQPNPETQADFACDVPGCGRSFATRQALSGHMRTHKK